MSLSANFPHQLALLLVALQTDKLPLCQHLDDPTEKSLVATLITYMNNRDFRTPITIARKTLGNQIRVKRSTLFAKLKNLKEKGILEESMGELPIRFTEHAIALMRQQGTDKKTIVEKITSRFFKVGRSSFPTEATQLLNKGIAEKQMRGLMAEAKAAKLTIQHAIQKFGSIIEKYEGKTLFLVFRDILRHPEKYEKSVTTPTASHPRLGAEAQGILATVANNDKEILLPGEQLQRGSSGWQFSDPAMQGGAPLMITDVTITRLRQRMRELVSRYQQQHGALAVCCGRSDAENGSWQGALQADKPLVRLRNGRQQRIDWHVLYSMLPATAKRWHGERAPTPRLGQRFSVHGVHYLVDAINRDIAALRILSGSQSGRIMTRPLASLESAEVKWQC